MKSNVVLIGMPGSGKSTLGVLLAKAMQKGFVDTDILIQQSIGESLQTILEQVGYQTLREMEAHLIASTEFNNSVVATGGSAVYGEKAMQHLWHSGSIVYLQASLATIEQRVNDEDTRGIARAPEHTLADVYSERCPLYERYADVVVDVDAGGIEQVLAEIIDQVGG